MITVMIKENEIEMKGHAGYAEKGKDIICSACSVLFQSFVKSVLLFSDDRITYKLESGTSRMTFPDGIKDKRTDHYLEFFITGVHNVAVVYPDYVRLYFS